MMILKREQGECFNCSNPATAVWHGGNPSREAEPVLAVCPVCAVEVLPTLIADAVAASGPARGQYLIRASEAALDRIKGVFWRAVACAGLAERDPRRIEEAERAALELEREAASLSAWTT